MGEDLLGGDSVENLQSYIYILELKNEMLQQYGKDITDAHSPLLNAIKKYEKFVGQLLGIFGLGIVNVGFLEEDNVLHQWDAYVSRYFSTFAEFNVELMDGYAHLITQCQ